VYYTWTMQTSST